MNNPLQTWNQTVMEPANRSHTNNSRRPKSPRWAMLNTFVDHQMRNLSRAAQGVWWVLYRETNNQGLARITIEQIGEKAGIGVSMVKVGLGELRALNMLVRVSRGSRNKGPSIYRLLPVSTVGPPATKEPFSTAGRATTKARKRPSITAGVPATATAGVPAIPQKEQEPGPPLGASAGPVDEEEDWPWRITA